MSHAIAKDAPYPSAVPDRDTWQYNYRADTHELVGFFAPPRAEEIAAVERGEARFALLPYRDVLVLAVRFGDLPWSDAAYSWHLVPPEQRTLPDPVVPPQRRFLLVALVDRTSRRYAARPRMVSFTPSFTQALHRAIRDQAARAWPGDEAYDEQLAELYRRYPTTDALVEAAIAQCRGGADDEP